MIALMFATATSMANDEKLSLESKKESKSLVFEMDAQKETFIKLFDAENHIIYSESVSAISYSQIKLGVMTYSYRHLPYEEMLQQCQRLNIHYVELDVSHANYLQYSPKEALKLIETAKKYGITIDVYHAGARD
ncbi:hypothetical protein LCGC14_2131170, partial [marine sediment metagenome]